ncbi:DUF2911 domain-containing protein [Roseivirga pacifica]|uniref:DUF2911 domain-containing protein n=1 Tax=Roseivirga pacifica TaxID=1267423 RepID=UPI00227C7BC0|nr:DUF2911 domain-containing protein [Roseivirga pacifica]
MKKLVLLMLTAFAISACSSGTEKESSTTYFVTKLGNDTLAIERINYGNNSISADVLLRSPNISLTSYQLAWNENNQLISMRAEDVTDLGGFGKGTGTVTQRIAENGDSLAITATFRGNEMTYNLANDQKLLPFIDMVHWPFDIALQRAHASKSDSTHQYLISGRRASDFIIHNTAGNDFTLRHPSRGVMLVKTNDKGQLTWLDAKNTTRKLIVERTNTLNFDELVAHYVVHDKENSPFGTLSPAQEGEFSFKGSDFKVTYGSPLKRGRDIYGGIVSYGNRWRTGANRATHFSTSKPIQINGNTVPAGEYTLFTIPEEDGGTLIINKQTGQNGQSYDESRDLMRVPMSRKSQDDVTESFTIEVVETEKGGQLQLTWDTTIYYVDFTF